MSNMTVIFNTEDYEQFRDWLKLNLDGLTWQGRFTEEFEEFWSSFFICGLSIEQLINRFNYANSCLKIGPLSSWFSWLKDKFVIYAFVYKGVRLFDLSKQSSLDVSYIANVLRNFFLGKFPYLDEYFSSVFQVGNVVSENLHICFNDISKEMNLSDNFNGTDDDEIMSSMEVTLYEEWTIFTKRIKKDFNKKETPSVTLRSRLILKRNFLILIEVISLFILGILIFITLKYINSRYEVSLLNEIQTYDPPFLSTDKTLKFKNITADSTPNLKYNIDLDEVDNVSDLVTKKDNTDRLVKDDVDFGTESEVSLTSWDSLPKDFEVANLEQSDYEELRKGGYRDTRFGNKKVYRVIINSVNSSNSRDQVNNLLENYGVTQVDNVRPGMVVPGGIYYNLFVPRKHLKEFLAQVMEVDDGSLYESRTRGKNPPGKNKVFVWIKGL